MLTVFNIPRRDIGHIHIETEMQLHSISVLLDTVAVTNWVVLAMMQLVMLYCPTMIPMDNVCVIVKVMSPLILLIIL